MPKIFCQILLNFAKSGHTDIFIIVSVPTFYFTIKVPYIFQIATANELINIAREKIILTPCILESVN